MPFVAIPTLFLRRILSVILAFLGTFCRLITCPFLRRQNRIGELPFVAPKIEEKSQQQQKQQNGINDWDSWNSEPTAAGAVADQIAEYRKQREAEAAKNKAKRKSQNQQMKQEQQSAALCGESDDLFSEIRPNVKAPKKLLLRPKQSGTKQRNLFAVQSAENGFSFQHVDRLDELGDLDFEQPPMNGEDGDSNWLEDEESIEMSQIDAVAREQRRLERERRNAARLAEHAAVQQQKRHFLVKTASNNNKNNMDECRIDM